MECVEIEHIIVASEGSGASCWPRDGSGCSEEIKFGSGYGHVARDGSGSGCMIRIHREKESGKEKRPSRYLEGYGISEPDGRGWGAGPGYGGWHEWADASGDGLRDPTASEAYFSGLTEIPAAEKARRNGALIALWESDFYGFPIGKGPLCPRHAAAGDVFEGQKVPRATFWPELLHWSSTRLWVVALYGPVSIHGHKVDSSKMEILEEVYQTKVPDCAHCGKPLRGTRHTRLTYEDALGVPTIGWHTGCDLDEHHDVYEIAINSLRPTSSVDHRPPNWIPGAVRIIVHRGRSRVAAGQELFKACLSS